MSDVQKGQLLAVRSAGTVIAFLFAFALATPTESAAMFSCEPYTIAPCILETYCLREAGEDCGEEAGPQCDEEGWVVCGGGCGSNMVTMACWFE